VEAIIVLYAMAWLWQNAMAEREHARRGTVSPRWQRKLARAGVGGQPPAYGSRDFVADLWGDFLQKRTEARRSAAPREGEGDPFTERVRRAKDVFHPKHDRTPPEPGAGLNPDYPKRPTEPRGQRNVTDVPCDVCGVKCRVIDYDTTGGAVLCGKCQEDGAPTRAPIPNPDEHDANIIPMFRPKRSNPKETPEMSTVDTGAEAGTFLVTAVEHCNAVAAAMALHAEGGEGEDFVASLMNEGVHAAPLGAVVAAQEASQVAADAWAHAAKALAPGFGVREAYEQAPGAGSREHVTGGE
jgi:hypothetical protein